MTREMNVGYRARHPKYGWYEVIAIPDTQHGIIRFDESGNEVLSSKYHILDGLVRDRKHPSFHQVGESHIHPVYGEYHIVELVKGKKAVVEFSNTGYRCLNTIRNITTLSVKDPMLPIICGVGYIGIRRGKNSSPSKSPAYRTWHNMIKRCYDPSIHEGHPTYKECLVCEEWHCFATFEEWFNKACRYEDWCLDKDILVKGNKIYSPETCCFVPNEINTLFTKRQKHRGKTPIGVHYCKPQRRFKECYKAFLTKGKENGYIGTFATPEEAFNAYKVAKEAWIKEVADKWKDQLDPKVYKAMCEYQVEITD